MGVKNTRGQLVCDSEVSEGGEGNGWSTGQPGPPVDNPGLQDSQAHSSNSYCTAQARSAVFKHKNHVHFNDYKTYNGSTTATNARRRGSDTLAITPTPRSGGVRVMAGVAGLILCVDLNQLPFTFPIDNVHLSRKAGLRAQPSANCNVRGYHHNISLAVLFRRSRLHLLAMDDVGKNHECALLAHRHH